MKQFILLVVFMTATVFTYSQKVKMSEEAKGKYVSKNVVEKEQLEKEQTEKEPENKITVYAILRAESETGSGFMQISLDESSQEIVTKGSSMEFPELIKLTMRKLSVKSEIDLLNYLAEQGWEIVAVQNETDKKTISRKYYLKKIISF